MANTYPLPRPVGFLHGLYLALLAFPVACFSLTVITDIAYWRTSNLLWLHFSEWLLLAGLVFGVLALLVMLIDWLFVRARPPWMAILCGIVVMLLATINSFVHTSDGWTAVVPWGLAFSVLTFVAMLVTAWFAHEGDHYE